MTEFGGVISASTHHHFSFVRPDRRPKPLAGLELQRLPGAVQLHHSVIWGEAEMKGEKSEKEKEGDERLSCGPGAVARVNRNRLSQDEQQPTVEDLKKGQ